MDSCQFKTFLHARAPRIACPTDGTRQVKLPWAEARSRFTLLFERLAIGRWRARPWPEPAAKGDTVWMGAADSNGCVVSYIQSVYWEFGSGMVLQDTGINWQNRGASFTLDPASHVVIGPRRKPFHTLIPGV